MMTVKSLPPQVAPPAMPHDIFISYSRRDLEAVNPIKEELEKAGFSCWMDIEDIESGAEEFSQSIVSAIEGSTAFLFFLSASSQASGWSLKELRFAQSLKRHTVLIRINDDVMAPLFSFNFGGSDIVDWRIPEQVLKLQRDLCRWTGKKILASANGLGRDSSVPRPAETSDCPIMERWRISRRFALWLFGIASLLLAVGLVSVFPPTIIPKKRVGRRTWTPTAMESPMARSSFGMEPIRLSPIRTATAFRTVTKC